MRYEFKKWAFASTALATAVLAVPAVAQNVEPEAEAEVVVVTGSRLVQRNLVTTSPVTQVSGEDIAIQGVTRVEDLINSLPQAFAAQASRSW
jgi:iron complex outermembrane recepter protein